MKGKIYFTILGLLLAESLLALLMASIMDAFLIEIVVAAWFLLTFAIVMSVYFTHPRHSLATALFAFVIGFLNALFVSAVQLYSWVIVILCVSAAGFVLTLDQIASLKKIRRPLPLQRKRTILEKELPKSQKVEVVVYDAKKQAPVVKKMKTAKKVAKKKTVKKTTYRAQRKVARRTAK